MAKKKRGDRFPLLIYTQLGQRWGRLGILLILASILLWLFAPRLIGRGPLRTLTLFPVLVGALLALYGFAARRVAGVQCFRSSIRIQSPIYPLVVSYSRLKATRPVQVSQVFDPTEEKAARRAWPNTFWGKTAIIVELKSFPLSKLWLRLWFNQYLFWPQGTGFVFLVEEWMGLSQQIDSYWSAYRTRRSG